MELGFARAEITPTTRGIGMLGWGMLDNIALSVATPLSARVMVVRQGENALVLCVAELAFMTRSIRDEVLKRLAARGLALNDHNVLLMATHTHSGPGGYTDLPFYDATIPGFQPEVLEAIVSGIVQAITEAWSRLTKGTLGYSEAAFAPEIEVAFNREPAAYNVNPDVAPTDDARLALDRTVRMLVGRDAGGELLGLMNWFAVHGTSVHSDNTALHFDNKGYAAAQLEASHVNAICGFAQGASGDVTPNFVVHKGRPWVRGKFVDDDESARYNGELQGKLCADLLQTPAVALSGRLLACTTHVDFTNVEVDADLADNKARRTGPAEIGMAMFFGTDEGPGLPLGLLPAQGLYSKARRLFGLRQDDPVQGNKVTWLEGTRGSLLGVSKTSRIPRLPLPERLRLVVDEVRKLEHKTPWTAHVLPVQLVLIGSVAIVAVPGEFTTVAGQRVRKHVAKELAPLGVSQVIFAGYANDYAGYVTTPEEYALQNYEGASTHFGQWTLPAYLTVLRKLARQMVEGESGVAA